MKEPKTSWNGLCPSGLHGLDYQGQPCDLCRAPDALQREIILRNEAKDPHYAPYCLPCPGLVRMRKVEPHYWRCCCGAECDYRMSLT